MVRITIWRYCVYVQNWGEHWGDTSGLQGSGFQGLFPDALGAGLWHTQDIGAVIIDGKLLLNLKSVYGNNDKGNKCLIPWNGGGAESHVTANIWENTNC